MERGKKGSRGTGLLFVLSGSSGAGKDAVLDRMKELPVPLQRAVTVTTRPQRPGEHDGIDYRFTSETDFQRMVEAGELIEWAQVYGHWYGVPKQQIKQALGEGKDVILKVDVQGAATIRRLVPEAVLVFLASPSEEYEQRLRRRETESDTDMKLRMNKVEDEMGRLPLFDYVVTNRQGELDSAVSQVKAIIQAERCRVNPRVVEVN